MLSNYCNSLSLALSNCNVLEDFYQPSLLILPHSLVVEGEIWRILFSDHTKLSSHMPSFSFPVLLLNKALRFE